MQDIAKPQAVRLAPREKRPFIKSALLVTSGISGAMLGFAVPNLVSGDGVMIAAKSVLLAVGGMGLSYIVNRLAVERGAPLMTIGYWGAGLVSVASIAVVSGGLFSATFSGLTINDVEQLRIEAHGEALSDFVSDTSKGAAQASRIDPAIVAIVSDLQQKHACEIAESCLSGHGNGGNGPVARAVLEELGRAQTLAQQVQTGGVTRDETMRVIDALYGEYESLAASADLSTDEKRQKLRSIHLEIKQASTRLAEAMPVTLLLAYAAELKAGVEIPGRQEASAKVSDILQQHGQTLSQLVESIPAQDGTGPSFPRATGVSDTFNYIGHFLPLAAIAAVVELVFPMSLWLYTVFTRSWANYRVEPPAPARIDREDEDFRRLVRDPVRENDLHFSEPSAFDHAASRPRQINSKAQPSGRAREHRS